MEWLVGAAARTAVSSGPERCYRVGMTEAPESYHSRIERKLNAAFAPVALEVIDESARHHGHSGWREGGETHFRVRIVAGAFAGRSRLERHRLVNDALRDELAERVHALAIEAAAP